ncbi:hypothetical protein M422DRAFT_47994 [Sphaerobolus stellatus SS14]|uniref:Uncharacterized protein n=1 Tax=Sphaerobolus stellatus (strain SS14) TaxID=990650 RepID=A0A0C9VWH8_SPHS4|nr:hypothetical protein M422DRAFT_47994 [Sphaerobolus stellatus SS14]
MHLLKLNKALHSKEKEKEKDRRLQTFPGGFGRVLTDEIFIALQEEAAARKKVKESQKKRKQVEKQNKQQILAEQKCQWDIICEQNAEASTTYKEECARLKALGVKRSSWPKDPKRVKKPTIDEIRRYLSPVQQGSSDSDEETGSDQGEEDEEVPDSEKEFWQ